MIVSGPNRIIRITPVGDPGADPDQAIKPADLGLERDWADLEHLPHGPQLPWYSRWASGTKPSDTGNHAAEICLWTHLSQRRSVSAMCPMGCTCIGSGA